MSASGMATARRRKLIVATLALVLVALPAARASCEQNGGGFRFPDHSNCSCATSGIGYYEVICPSSGDPKFTIKLAPGRSVEVQCLPNTSPSDYSWLPEVTLGQEGHVDYFSFRMCPLPNNPLINTISRLGVSKFYMLYFQNFGNLSNALTRSHLTGLQKISRLVLSSNGLTDLPDDLFDDMTNLTLLNLRSNNVRLTSNLFESLPNLKQLELGHNGLTSIPEGLFRHMGSLTHLNLWQNNLILLSSEVFKGLDKLEELDLSTNEIQTFSSDVFRFVPNLKRLNLFRNNLSSLPKDLFAMNQNLEFIKLTDNRQVIKELPDYLLSNLTQLTELNFYNSRIQRIPETLIWESLNIINISLRQNEIANIPNEFFKEQNKLLKLDLSYNRIAALSDDVFLSLVSLEVLLMDYNQIETISEKLFTSLHSLKELSMVHNNLRKIIHNAFAFTKNLEKINFAQNSLSFMQEDYNGVNFLKYEDNFGLRTPLQSLENLQYLNLSRNAVTNIFTDWRVSNVHLKNLDLSHNSVMKISFNDVQFLSKNVTVDLRYNNISEIDFTAAAIIATTQDSHPDAYRVHTKPPAIVRVLVEDNPITCDCVLYHFVLYLKDELDPQVRSMVEVVPENLKCTAPPNMKDKLVTSLQPYEMLCTLDNSESTVPKLCPQGCECFVRPYNLGLIVNCSNAIINEFPSLPNVDSLGLNQTELLMENCMLTTLPSQKNVAYDRITNLFLDNNNITSIDVNNLPSNIRNIDLRRNQIEYLNKSVVETLENLTSLSQLWISGNPFACDCINLPFLSFMQTHYEKIKDFPEVTCSDGTYVSKLVLGDLCGTPSVVIAVSVIVAISGLIVGILAALYYKYQQEIKVWLFAKGWCLWWVTEEELDKDKLYDAFISFSHKDEEFVVNKLLNTLESGARPFKICMHFRDWVAGEFIPTQIARSVEDSRRTLVVLSPNFLESVWGKMEFRVAHSRALKEGRARVIIVLYGEIGPTENLDAELQAYLSMNTYVKWGDPWFWDKLRYALPHPPHRKHHLISNGMSEKKGFDDKLELIHPTTPTTPPAQNTPPAHQAHTNPLMNHVDSVPNGIAKITSLTSNGTVTMNGLKVNGNAKHSDV